MMTDQTIQESEKLPFFPRRKRWLIPIGILFAAMVIGLPVGVLMGSSAVKDSEPFKITMDKLRLSDAIQQAIGKTIEPGMIASGSHDARSGTYELTFTIRGDIDQGVVRSWCVSEGEGQPWVIDHLSVGIGGRKGREITLIGDPKNPPWSTP